MADTLVSVFEDVYGGRIARLRDGTRRAHRRFADFAYERYRLAADPSRLDLLKLHVYLLQAETDNVLLEQRLRRLARLAEAWADLLATKGGDRRTT